MTGAGGSCLDGAFLFGEVEVLSCILPFPTSLVSLFNEALLEEWSILENESAAEGSFDDIGISANFLPRALYNCDFLMPLP